MIKRVIVTNYLGESIEMELMNPEKSGFNIHEITGIGPEKAEINTSPKTTSDGSIFNSARGLERNITFIIEFIAPNEMWDSVESTRQGSYKYFPIETEVHLEFETDNRTVNISGHVESNEPVIFNQREHTQISIICEYPWFYLSGEDGNQTTVFYGTEANFEFPFSNESLTEPLLEMGIIHSSREKNIYYIGDKEIGVVFQIDFIGPVTNLSIHDITTNEAIFINSSTIVSMTGAGLNSGDELIVSTVDNQIGVWLIRSGQIINIINAANRDAEWFKLRKGDNLIAYTADVGAQYIQFRASNRIIFEGI